MPICVRRRFHLSRRGPISGKSTTFITEEMEEYQDAYL